MFDDLKLPFFKELEQSERILLAGAGGGFDVFSALPLYFALRAAGKTAFLANLSFSTLTASMGRTISPTVIEITAESSGSRLYFPEMHLATFLAERGDPTPIYCFERNGYGQIAEGYRALLEELKFDTLVLVDGGTDSLMRGDEDDLGTPEEDIVSIAATHDLPIARKLFACLGFGVDRFHGVSHDFVLEAVADIAKRGGYLGAFSLTPDMPAVHAYKRAAEFVMKKTAGYESIVSTSILAAIDGHFGDHHATNRTSGSTLYINPLMSFYWCFQLEVVASRILYLEAIKKTESHFELTQVITNFRINLPTIRSRRNIPL